MSFIPQFNYPKFYRITKELRDAGFVIHSPAELDTPEQQKYALESVDGDPNAFVGKTGLTWGDTLAKDVKLIADVVDGVIVMDGWEKSRGARLEVFTANLVSKPIFVYQGEGSIRPLEYTEFMVGITGGTYGRAA